jgi:hypothetical protein
MELARARAAPGFYRPRLGFAGRGPGTAAIAAPSQRGHAVSIRSAGRWRCWNLREGLGWRGLGRPRRGRGAVLFVTRRESLRGTWASGGAPCWRRRRAAEAVTWFLALDAGGKRAARRWQRRGRTVGEDDEVLSVLVFLFPPLTLMSGPEERSMYKSMQERRRLLASRVRE